MLDEATTCSYCTLRTRRQPERKKWEMTSFYNAWRCMCKILNIWVLCLISLCQHCHLHHRRGWRRSGRGAWGASSWGTGNFSMPLASIVHLHGMYHVACHCLPLVLPALSTPAHTHTYVVWIDATATMCMFCTDLATSCKHWLKSRFVLREVSSLNDIKYSQSLEITIYITWYRKHQALSFIFECFFCGPLSVLVW